MTTKCGNKLIEISLAPTLHRLDVAWPDKTCALITILWNVNKQACYIFTDYFLPGLRFIFK